MAEFCYTNYVFFSNEINLTAFYEELKEISSKCNDRLSNITSLVFGTSSALSSEIGGVIEYISEMDGDSFQVNVETKYTPVGRNA